MAEEVLDLALVAVRRVLVADRAGECWGEAVSKIGEELAKLGKAKGTRGQAMLPGPGRGKSENRPAAPRFSRRR